MSESAGAGASEIGPLSARTLGDFVLRELVGAGGFGDVYVAEQQTLRRDAVVKVQRAASADPRGIDEFLREAKLASQLDHPYAAHIYAFGAEPDGVCWIAMERVRGASLRAMLEAQGPMPLERFVPLLERICEVVHTAHEQGIVHRDLKPDNVMVISRAGRLLPKLLDFGIAHVMSEAQPAGPERGGIRGSPSYMAPELWVDPRAPSPAVDQYALGALAYEALTGRLAFPGRTMHEIARAHARPGPRPLGEGLPTGLGAVIDRALARRAGERYGNVLELAQAFRDASGLGKVAQELPQLDEELRLRVLGQAPQPIADGVAAYDAAKNAHQAREALRVLARTIEWYVALLALACRSRVGSGGGDDTDQAQALIGDLRRHGLTPAGWISLAKQLTRPFASTPDTYPIPELVLLLHPRSGPDAVAAIIESTLAESLPDTSEDTAAQALARELPLVTQLLRATLFLADYLLVVARGETGEVWMGTRSARRLVRLARELPAGRVVLTDGEGVPLVILWPLIQAATAVPGHGEQLFLLAGPGRQGARLLSVPHGFAHHDADVWEWFRRELFDRTESESSALRGNPYRGLSSYRASDADWFFGRERESEALVNRLKLDPFVAVVGPSGIGKSSFVHAGVAPLLGWRVVSMRPGRAPLAQLAAQLAHEDMVIGDVAGDALAVLAERMRAAAKEVRGLLLVVDQFEELLTLCSDRAERERFVRLLLALTQATDGLFGVVITLRDDFLIRVEQLPGLGPALARGIQLLGPLSGEALARIIVEPARRFGYELEDPVLAGRMVEAVAGLPAAVALISFTAARLWELRDRHFHQLSAKAYEAIGGVTGALARHADETVEAMSGAERALVRKAFRHLVTFDGTRAVIERAELHELLGGGTDAERVVERLVAARLLISSESDAGTAVVEIVHEALIREWPRLVEWRREDAEGSRFHEQLRAAARQWQDRGQPRGLLWRGDALAEYQLWVRRHAPSLAPLEAVFGDASVAEAARGLRLRRILVAGAVAITAVFVVVLFRASRAADRARAEAEALLRDSYFEQGRLRVLEGDKLGALGPLGNAYRRGATGAASRLLLGEAARPTAARLLTLEGHTAELGNIAYSPDGKWLATASADGTAQIWDAATGAPRATIRHPGGAGVVAFSPDSRLLASSGADPVVRVWDVIAGREIAALSARLKVRQLAFSPDGATLLTVAAAQVVQLWHLPGGAPAGALEGHGRLQGARFCQRGSCIVTWDTGKVVVWDAATLAQRGSYQHTQGAISSVAVSRTGALIAVGAESGELVLLRGDGGLIERRTAHEAMIFDLAISPDETLVLSGSDDRTARLWSAAGGPLEVLAGHRAPITRVRFTEGGDRAVTMSADGTARLWSTSGMLLGELAGHTNVIMAADLSADGARLATASWDHTAMVWDLARAEALRAIVAARDAAPAQVAFDPSGSRLAVGRENGSLVVVDAASGATVCSEAAGGPPIEQLVWVGADTLAVGRRAARAVELRRGGCAVGPALDLPAPITLLGAGGDRLATVAGGVVQVWRGGRVEASFTDYPGEIIQVGVDGDDVYALLAQPIAVIIDGIGARGARQRYTAPKLIADVHFDRARGQLLVACMDQSVHVWDTATGALVRKLTGTGVLWKVRMSPDGAIVIGVGGVTPAMWDAATGAPLGRLEGHSSLVQQGDFIGDRIFATAASNHTLLVSDVVTARPLLRIPDVDELVVSPDRKAVALVGAKGVRLWTPRFAAPAPSL